MNVRDLKLAIACGYESDDVKSLNKFFGDLFSDLKVFTYKNNDILVFMNGSKYIMEHNIETGFLYIDYYGFWGVLIDQYNCTQAEIRELIAYKVYDTLIGNLNPKFIFHHTQMNIESDFDSGLLVPYIKTNNV